MLAKTTFESDTGITPFTVKCEDFFFKKITYKTFTKS